MTTGSIYIDYKSLIGQLIEKSGSNMYFAASAAAILEGLKETYTLDKANNHPEPISKEQIFEAIRKQMGKPIEEGQERYQWIRSLRELGNTHDIPISLKEAKLFVETHDYEYAIYNG